MKKKIFAMAFTAAACASVLAACSGGSDSGSAGSKFVGEWKIKSMTVGGENFMELLEGTGADISDMATLNIQEGGTYSMKMNIYGSEQSADGTWEVSDNSSIIITSDGQNTTAKLNGNELVLSDGEGDSLTEMIFTK